MSHQAGKQLQRPPVGNRFMQLYQTLERWADLRRLTFYTVKGKVMHIS